MHKITKPHLFISGINSTESYKTAGLPIGAKPFPVRNRQEHGDALMQDLIIIWQNFSEELAYRADIGLPTRHGEYLTFKGAKYLPEQPHLS